MVNVAFRGASIFFELVLSDLLVEHMIKELRQILLCKIVVKFSSMGLNDVASSRWGAVGYIVFLWQLNVLGKHFTMFYGRVLKTYESLSGRGVSLITWSFPIVFFHYFIKVSSCIFVSFTLNFIKKFLKLFLYSLSFGFKIGAPLADSGCKWLCV